MTTGQLLPRSLYPCPCGPHPQQPRGATALGSPPLGSSLSNESHEVHVPGPPSAGAPPLPWPLFAASLGLPPFKALIQDRPEVPPTSGKQQLSGTARVAEMASWGQGSVQSRDVGHENPCPLLPTSPGWAPGTPFPLQSAHGEDLPVLIISAGSPCISHTPSFQLFLLTAGWGRKKGIKSILRCNIFPFLQAGSFRAVDGCGALPECSRDQPLPDTDWLRADTGAG